MKTAYIILAGLLACVSCTNNNTDGAAMGLKAGKNSMTSPEPPSSDTGKRKKVDMDQHEMYNYADSSTNRSQQ